MQFFFYFLVDDSVNKICVFTIYNNGKQAVKQRLQALMACSDNFVKHLENKQRDSCER